GIAGALLFAQHAVRRAEMLHHTREARDDLAALRIVGTHATQPQTVFLRAIEDRKLLLLDELVALRCTETERVAVALQRQEQLGAVVVVPLTGVHRAAPQPDDHRQVLYTHRALILA